MHDDAIDNGKEVDVSLPISTKKNIDKTKTDPSIAAMSNHIVDCFHFSRYAYVPISISRTLKMLLLFPFFLVCQSANLAEQIRVVNQLLNIPVNSTQCPFACYCADMSGILSINAVGLTGSIPVNIGLLSNLTSLSLTGTKLTGTIPSSFCDLTSLDWVYVVGSALSGTIPKCVWELPNLKQLYLSQAIFTGTVQSSLPDQIVTLDLSRNILTGNMPMPGRDMISMSMGTNAFSGTLPSDFFSRSSYLTRLDFSNNRLHGEIPSAISLTYANFRTNQFNGSVPFLGPKLRYLDLSFNIYSSSMFDPWYHNLTLQIAGEGNHMTYSACYPPFVCGEQDIDECGLLRFVCPNHSTCSDGWSPRMSYTCACYKGYEMNGTGHCEDINECLLPNACLPGACVNLVGEYMCCPVGEYNPIPEISGAKCVSCYTDYRYILNPSPKPGLLNLSSYVRCFGECTSGVSYRIRYTKSDACLPEQELPGKCEYPCIGLDMEGAPSMLIADVLYAELTRGDYLTELVNATISLSSLVIQSNASAELRILCGTRCAQVLQLVQAILPDTALDIAEQNGLLIVAIPDPPSKPRTDIILSSVAAFALLLAGMTAAWYQYRELYLLPPAVAAAIRPPLLMRCFWSHRGDSETGYFYTRYVPEYHGELPIDLSAAGFEGWTAQKVYNPVLVSRFVGAYNIRRTRMSSGNLFNRSTWVDKDVNGARTAVYDKFRELCTSFPWNVPADPLQPAIIAACHGTSYQTARNICETGFAANTAILDSGWYGRGIYFTSYPVYCVPYTCTSSNGAVPSPALIISYIVPCNVYPVIESAEEKETSLLGQAIVNGYQTHYVRVDGTGHIGSTYDEIVVSQEAQILPVYIVRLDLTSSLSLAKRLVTQSTVENV